MCKRTVLSFIVILAGIAAVYPVLNRKDEVKMTQVASTVDAERQNEFRQLMQELAKRAAKFPGEAGILIKDLETNQTIMINSSRLFPSASLVKVPIMAAYFQAESEGKLKLTDTLTLERKHKVRSSSKLYFARTGTKFMIKDLIERMITESDNTASNMLVDNLGFGYLNQKFVEFGLKNTDLRRGIMDLAWRQAGIENYTTAEDMAFLLEKMYRRELISPEASDEMIAVLKRQKVNDRIPRMLPNGLVIAHKTGLLKDTVSDCGIVYTPKGDFVICVLTAEIRSFRSAKTFIGRVAASAYDRCYKKPSEEKI